MKSANAELRRRKLPEDHAVEGTSTMVIGQEKNQRKRKFIESICIKSKSLKLCNVGGSVHVADIWDPSLPIIAKNLKDLD